MELFVQLFLNGIVSGSLYALIAISFGLIYGATRHFHIAHAGVLAAAGYVAAGLVDRAGLPTGVATIAALLAGCLLGMAILVGVYGPLQRLGGSTFILFLVSLGLLTVIENVFGLWLGQSAVRVALPEALGESVTVGSFSLTRLQLALVALTSLSLAVLLVFLRRTRTGRNVRALADNPEFLQILGSRPIVVQAVVYGIASLLVAIAGIYIAADTGMRPGVGTTYFIFAVMAVILGGIGSITGAFGAAMALGVLQNILLYEIPDEWAIPIVLAAFLVAITIRPRGFASSAGTLRTQG